MPLMRIRVGGSWPVDPVTYYRAGTTSSVDFPMQRIEVLVNVLGGSLRGRVEERGSMADSALRLLCIGKLGMFTDTKLVCGKGRSRWEYWVESQFRVINGPG